MVYVKTMNRDKKKEAKKEKEANGREKKRTKKGEERGNGPEKTRKRDFFCFSYRRTKANFEVAENAIAVAEKAIFETGGRNHIFGQAVADSPLRSRNKKKTMSQGEIQTHEDQPVSNSLDEQYLQAKNQSMPALGYNFKGLQQCTPHCSLR